MKSEFEITLEKLTTLTKEKYGSHAYATGYLTVLADAMYNSLSEHQQMMVARQVRQTLSQYETDTV
jgi:hypothetical protein